MAGSPKGEIRNDRNRNTAQPSFEPAKKIAMLTNTPMPETISKNVAAQQNRNVNIGVAIVSTTTSGAAIILNISLNKNFIKMPLSWLFFDVYFYLYFTILGVWGTMLSSRQKSRPITSGQLGPKWISLE